MRTTIASTLALCACILGAHSIELLTPRDGEAPRVVRHEIQRRQIADPIQHDRLRRRTANVVESSLTNEETLYFMDISMGTPPQNLRMHIDTGSSDLWVNVATSRLCESNGNPCGASGTYSANDSSTYRYLNSQFNISYVDGTGSVGDYAKDTVRLAGVTMDGQQFGIGYQSSSLEGIIGIGYPENEVAVTYGYPAYPNIPANLVEHGYINTNAYSLWLNDLDASKGEILFGGVNTEKYTGSLQTVPILPVDNRVYAEFVIALTAVGVNGDQGSIANNIAQGALLDSGSSLMYLPDNIAQSIYSHFGARYDSSQGAAFVDCSLAHQQGTIDFTFSSPTISVPLNELVIVAGEQNGASVCILGIGPAGESTPVLGDTFIRSAYIVYDIDNNEISLAQTDFNSKTDNIQEIKKSGNVPDATNVQNAVTSVAQVSDGARLGSGGITFGSSAAAGSSSSSPNAARPTAALGYNAALIGAAAGAGLMLGL